jgi:hypothetical protein
MSVWGGKYGTPWKTFIFKTWVRNSPVYGQEQQENLKGTKIFRGLDFSASLETFKIVYIIQ